MIIWGGLDINRWHVFQVIYLEGLCAGCCYPILTYAIFFGVLGPWILRLLLTLLVFVSSSLWWVYLHPLLVVIVVVWVIHSVVIILVEFWGVRSSNNGFLGGAYSFLGVFWCMFPVVFLAIFSHFSGGGSSIGVGVIYQNGVIMDLILFNLI